MKIKFFISVVICNSFFISFQVQAFDLGEFAKKTLESAKNTQQIKQTKSEDNAARPPASVSNADLPKFNIRGMYLGMPVSDASAILSNYNPRMKVTKSVSDIGAINGARIRGSRYLVSLRANQVLRTSTDERFEIAVNTPQNAETVMGIARYQNLGRQILLSDMRALLAKKYGDPLFESLPDASGSNPYYILSWSLDPKGKPQKNKLVIQQCGGISTQGVGQLGIVTVALITANIKKKSGQNYQKCGFTFIVRMLTGYVNSKNATTYAYNTILYNGNENRKSVKKTIVYTEKVAKRLEAEKMKKLRNTEKPRL